MIINMLFIYIFFSQIIRKNLDLNRQNVILDKDDNAGQIMRISL